VADRVAAAREELKVNQQRPLWIRLLPGAAIGFPLGFLAALMLVLAVMPGLMIVTHPSTRGFDETVAALEDAIRAQGWSSPGTMDLQASMAKQGVDFDPRVQVIKLCNAGYAKRVLTDARHVSSLMPCSISVWEDDSGRVFVSKMNTGLMGKMFGGTVAEVMGGSVARDEEAILASVIGE
jgi:uncharacterized protein (DUF302 family)